MLNKLALAYKNAANGWRGAQSDSMDEISRRFACAELPLSVSWRCARSIVEVAASFVPARMMRPISATGLRGSS